MPSVPPAKAEAPLILTIDAGTSSARAPAIRCARACHRGRGRAGALQHSQRPRRRGRSRSGRRSGAGRLVALTLRLEQAGPLAGQMGAVAVDTMVSNILAIDAAGGPDAADHLRRHAQRPRRKRAAAQLSSEQSRANWLPLRTSYWPARLASFRRVQPVSWRRPRAG